MVLPSTLPPQRQYRYGMGDTEQARKTAARIRAFAAVAHARAQYQKAITAQTNGASR